MKLGEAFYKLARYPAHLFFITYAIFLSGLMLSSFFENAVLFLFVYVLSGGALVSLHVWRFPILNAFGASALAAATSLGVYLWVGTSASVFPADLKTLMLVVGVLSISTIAGLGAVVALPFRRFRRYLRLLDKEERERKQHETVKHQKMQSRFSDRLKELTTVVLLAFSLQFVVIPFISNVSAAPTGSQELTSEEFIKTYDPNAEYETRGEPVEKEIQRRVPLDPASESVTGTAPNTGTPSVEELKEQYPNLTEEELKNLLVKCELEGCSSKELEQRATQKNNEKAVLSEQQKRIETLKQLNLNAEMLLELYQNGTISTAEFGALTAHGLSEGKIGLGDLLKSESLAAAAGAFMDKYPILKWSYEKLRPLINWVFPGIGLLIEAYKLDQAHGGHVTKVLGAAYDASVRTAETAGTFLRENPQAIGLVIGIGVITVVATVATIPLCGGCGGAAVLWTVGALGTIGTAVTLGVAFADGGTDGVLKEVFSEEVLDAAARGDWEEVIGGGSVELVTFVFMNMPQNPAKIAQVLGALDALKALDSGQDVARLIQSLRNAKQAFTALQQAGKMTDAGMQFLGLLIKEQALKGAYYVDDFLTFLTEPGALNRNLAYLGLDGSLAANLNKQGERMQNLQALGYRIDDAKQVVGEEWDGLMRMVGGGGGTKIKVDGDILIEIQHRETKTISRVPLGKKKVDPPSWTKDAQWIHSTAGEIKNGKFKGGHLKQSLPKDARVNPISSPDKTGVYKAEVEVFYDGIWQKKKSTMFPDNWDEVKLKQEVDYAFNNRKYYLEDPNIKDSYIGETSEGINILFHYDSFDDSYNFYAVLP